MWIYKENFEINISTIVILYYRKYNRLFVFYSYNMKYSKFLFNLSVTNRLRCFKYIHNCIMRSIGYLSLGIFYHKTYPSNICDLLCHLIILLNLISKHITYILY